MSTLARCRISKARKVLDDLGKNLVGSEFKVYSEPVNNLVLNSSLNNLGSFTVKCRVLGGNTFTSFLDSGSVGNGIVSYLDGSMATKLSKRHIKTCDCSSARTCTAVGCFTTDKCITSVVTLQSILAKLESVRLSFRIVQGIPKTLL